MLRHSIYSVRDKKKVDAEVIDIREITGAKGVRYQIVGRHPEDGTTVTTFCSSTVADDYRNKLGTLTHGLNAEGIEVDSIPESSIEVVSTDGTPVDDDLETFVEDPLVGSASAGTLTSAKVLAAEGELSKTSCCCGATEDKPCACMTADEPMQCSSTEPKCACYATLDVKAAETGSKFEETDTGSIGVTVNGDWAGPGGDGKKMAIDIKLDPYQYHMMRYMDGLTTNTAQGWFEEIVNEGRKPKKVMDEYITGWAGDDWRKALDEGTSDFAADTVAGIDVQTPSQIAIETPDSDELIVPDPDLLVNGDGRVLGQQSGKVNTTPLHAEEDDIAHASDRAEMIMQEHIKKGIVREHEYYTLDFDGNMIETDDDPSGFTELGREVFESFYSSLVEGTDESDICYHCGTTDDVESCWSCDVSKCIECDHDKMRSDEDGHTYCDSCEPDDGKSAEFESEPAFAHNKRVLIPTAVIGGLALAYFAKPELLSGSFDRISEMLGKMTKKKDKTE